MTRFFNRLLILAFSLFAIIAIFLPRNHQGAQTPTFNKEVVRILQKNCQTCHHAGDIAPMSLMTYAETKRFATAIKLQTQSRQMPPWKPVQGCGDFTDSRFLTNEEIATLAAWADAGAPEGNPADLPAPIQFGDGWALGTPDLVLTPDEAYTPPTEGDMYRCFTIPTTLRGDRYVAAIDVKPGNRAIVHHVIAYLDPTGASVALDQKDPGPGYTSFGGPGFDNTGILGGWAPGGRGYSAGDNNGILMRKDSRVVIQVHYHPTGAVEKDRTQIGVYFAGNPRFNYTVKKEMQLLPLVNQRFTIPAGEKNYKVEASFTNSLFPAQIVAITPHMHLLGRQIKVEMTLPGQTTPTCLVNIDDWNFQWQGTYNYKQPVTVPTGAKLKLTAIYDNSAGNPLNPNNPPKPVSWGEATTDEMALAFIGFTLDAFNVQPSAPQLNDVTVDQNNNLIVTGTGFTAGADIEINGHRLGDTRTESDATATTKLLSSEMWKVPASPGQMVEVKVINTDGVRTTSKAFVRSGNALAVVPVSAASYSGDGAAPEAILAAFGAKLATSTEVTPGLPLPTTLAGTKVRINGELAPLFFVSPNQINFLVPSIAQNGEAIVEVTLPDGTLSRSTMMIQSTMPALFTADSSGKNAPAALITADGIEYRGAGNPDGTTNPIKEGEFLVLFGTGFRKAAAANVKITIGAINAPVLYSGEQPGYVGLDQINTQIPKGVSGLVDLVVTVNGKAANVVKVNVKNQN